MLDFFRHLNKKEKVVLSSWAAIILISCSILFIAMAKQQIENINTARYNQLSSINKNIINKNHTSPETSPPPGHEKDTPRTIQIGIYLDRIPELSIIGSYWKAEFYIWFNWVGDGPNPGETFQIVNGEILSKNLVKTSSNKKNNYALYRVITQITNVFDVSRFPRDDYILTINIEDSAHQSYEVKFTTISEVSDFSSRVAIPGYKVTEKFTEIRPHSYKTSRGDPDLPIDFKQTYSQFVYGIKLIRQDWGATIKTFIIMYVAVIAAIFGIFIKSPSDRLVLTGGALFACAANFFITASLTPENGVTTLADQINWIGSFFIILSIIQSIIYQELTTSFSEAFTRYFDMISISLLLSFYTLINISLPLLSSYQL